MSTPNASGGQASTGRSRKRILQQIYRSIEADDFAQLRQIIQETTHENPQTRHDILMKAAEIIKQLAREYYSLLAEHQATLSSRNSSPSAGPSTQHSGFYMPAASYFPPESRSVNRGHQTMQMHPHMPLSNAAGNIYDSTANTDVAPQNDPYYTYRLDGL